VIELTKGQELALTTDSGQPLTRLQLGVGWDKEPTGSVVHLGDNTSGVGEGDDEVVTVDLGKVYEKVDTIVLFVSSYQGHTLEWIANAYCRLVVDDEVELARFRLTGGVPETGVVMAKLFRNGDQWRLRAIGEGIAVKVPSESVEALRPYL
jgi:stress response protein SCP2